MRRSKRIAFALYGFASALIFLWVPWRGYENPVYAVPKDRWKPTYLGYGPVWAPTKPPAAFVAYDTENAKYAEYQRLHENDCIEQPQITKEEQALGFRPDPPLGKRYCVEPPTGQLRSSPPVQPKMPEGYISPATYGWATVDYNRVLVEFGALTGLLLATLVLTHAGGNRTNESE